MGSFNDKGGDRGPKRRRKPFARPRADLRVESLENRALLTGPSSTPPAWHPTTTNLADVKNGPLALAGQQLVQIYQEYLTYAQSGGQGGAFKSSLSKLISFNGTNGTNVGVDIRGYGDFVSFQTALRNIGMNIGAVDPTHQIVEGFLPISQLPTVAQMPNIVGMSPLYKAISHVGSASNQADQALFANVARTQYSVDGTGVKVGVLSDSVNQFQGGLSASVASGDLPSNVQVLVDGAAGSSDEGRAMLEQIHDIAPGASLAFSTASDPSAPGDIGFANGIRALAQVNSKVIVDDISYLDEPFYQDGIISQAITDVVNNQGVTYLSAAGNQANSGYESQFRGVNATVAGVGTGRFMNFNPDPSGNAVTNLPITVTQAGEAFVFQFDNPFYTTNGVTSDLDIFILDSNNNVVASGTTNNIATQQPLEIVNLPGAGNYTVAVRVNAGSPDVGHIVFLDPVSNGVQISQQFGSAGQTFYPTTLGHESANSTIGVGAVPWFDAPPFTNANPIKNEGFSSFGPALYVFDPNGARFATPQVRQAPDVSAPDGNDTSFFIPGLLLSTTNPPPGTGAATGTELDGNKFPNFFGTSSAAPNLAAVAALLKQLNPSATETDILNAFKASAVPLNGATKGQWNPQGGFGIVKATDALNAIDLLRVTAATPAPGAVLTTSPNAITLTFSRAVNFSTVQASDLVFTTVPANVSVKVGTPIQVSTTQITFPISLSSPAGVLADGNYAFKLADGAVTSADNRPLAAYTQSFTLNDTIAPRVSNVIFSGRTITIQFTEAMRADTISAASIYLVRTGSSGVFGNATNVILNGVPGFQITFDPIKNAATIDLSNVPQSQLPSDNYALVIPNSTVPVTDLVGNVLDGEFNGPPPAGNNAVFPSGDGKAGGTFIDYLPNVQLQPPTIQSVGLDQVLGPAGSPSTSDTGIAGDQNTKVKNPFISGHITSPFLTALQGVVIVAEFNGLHSGSFDLGQGVGGRGFSGTFDVTTTTDAQGNFVFQAPANLPDGLNTVRLIVIGQSEFPPLPGLSSLRDAAFRVDTTDPQILSAGNLNPDTKSSSGFDYAPLNNLSSIAQLTNISIAVSDPVFPSDLGNPLAVPTQLSFNALDPTRANNISNYSLIRVGAVGSTAPPTPGTGTDFSNFITSATFVPTDSSFANNPNRQQTSDPFFGRVDLTFAAGLPSGQYQLIMRGPQSGFSGVTDAAGNPIDGDQTKGGPDDFVFTLNLEPVAAFVTNVQAVTPNTGDPTNLLDVTVSGPRSYFEIPQPGSTPRAVAPPTAFFIDFSNPLDPTKDYTNAVQLLASANTPGGASDGDFGVDPTFTTGVGYTRVPGTTVTLVSSIPGHGPGQPGYHDRLLLRLAPGTTLAADHYRLFIPNRQQQNGADLRIFDIFNNQVDGEFLGNQTASGAYEDLLPTGQMRQGLSGDGTAGGTFETSFIVVPNGNVIYARPDYVENPFLPDTAPDGSRAKPYSVLAAEAVPNALNGGDLNSVANFGTGFNANYDRSGDGSFERSAFYAAQVLSANGPVVIVALPGAKQVNPATGAVTQKTFVLQAPAGSDPSINDGSASVPGNTDLVFAPGSALKFLNASLFVQNQGSSLQVNGGPNPEQQVTFTSYHDDSVGGPAKGVPSDKAPRGGDWGGIVFRNFDDTSNGGRIIPVAPGPLYLGTPHLGISGSDDALSVINYANIKFGGGNVPATDGFRFDAITLFNSRPAITNTKISLTGGAGGAQAAISGDFDSFREDLLARGPLVRRVSMANNSINGILVRAELTGVAQPTDAIFYPDNSNLGIEGGSQNYDFFAPLPYVFVSRLEIGTMLQQDTGGLTTDITDRLYIDPGAMLKFQRGAAIDVNNPDASINIGDRTYFNQFDLRTTISPNDPVPVGTANDIYRDGKFHAETSGDARVVLTSLFDDNATTAFFDPNTGTSTTIVAPIDSDNGGAVNLPTPGNVPPLARWGGISVTSGARAVIDEAQFYYGGGSVNTASGTIPQRDVLAFEFAGGESLFGVTTGAGGTKAMVTNNDFFDNGQAAISDWADGLLAGDALRPLVSGHPFFRGNVMQRNEINGLEVLPIRKSVAGITFTFFNNLNVDSVWDSTDLTYVLRSTIALGGTGFFGDLPTPDSKTFTAELKASQTLTLQSALPDTLLANGSHIPRPGESLVVKLLNDPANLPIGDGVNGMPASNIMTDNRGGAGFIVGQDDGVDPTADPYLDAGAMAQLRIVGIAGNETTGQQRIPVVMTSLHDDSVGTTVRGVKMFQAQAGNTTAPAAGDGGVILFGANSLSDYNLYDPRDGSIIDNADIRFLTRIEQQGGGIMYGGASDPWTNKLGITPATQFNTYKAMTISNSNLASFSQVGVISHPSGVNALDVAPPTTPGGFTLVTRDGKARGEGTLMFMVNNTITNMPVGVRIVSENVNNTNFPSPAVGVFLNNTFANDPFGIQTQAPAFNGQNDLSHVYFLVMDNIFAGATSGAIQSIGQNYRSQAQYNLYDNANEVTGIPDNQPVIGSPGFINPAGGNFGLLPTSAAIDAARAELGPSNFGNFLAPIADQQLDGTVGIRNTTGRTDPFGGELFDPISGNLVTLPGYPLHNFIDLWTPAIPGTPGSIQSTTSFQGSVYSWIPAGGKGTSAERDQRGYLRIDDLNVADVGFGSRPYFDIGANEFRELFPPHIVADPTTGDSVVAVVTDPTTTTGTSSFDIYKVGGVSGTNKSLQDLVITFDSQIDPTSLNNKTILLQASGGDGIFGNGNSSADRNIDLSGKLTYDNTKQQLTVHIADAGLLLPDDVYRIVVLGDGSSVVHDPEGNALDGENLDVNALQKALPTGDGVPGGTFQFTFIVNTTASVLVPGSLHLNPAIAASTPRGGFITKSNLPSFVGTIKNGAASSQSISPLGGQTIVLDFAGPDGIFGTADDRLNAGTALTATDGSFTVTVGADGANTGLVKNASPLPDTNYNVGKDGFLGINPNTGGFDDFNYSSVRVRVIDQSGNQSPATDPNARAWFVVDSTSPTVTSSSPVAGSQATVNGTTIPISIVVNENLDPATVNASTIRVVRAGGDEVFGNANDVPLGISGNISLTPLLGSASGAEILTFSVTGASASDFYQVTLLGTGSGPITDIAGNALAGAGTGKPGTDYNLQFVVFNPGSAHLLYVGQTVTNTSALPGSRQNPFPTIKAGLNAATVGDVVGVLPGVYNEQVTLKSMVRLLSADNSSTNSSFVPGQALQTIIRTPTTVTGQAFAVQANNSISTSVVQTEIAGFTISNPLVGDPNRGSINPSSIGVMLNNAEVLVDKNYIVDSGYGIVSSASGAVAGVPVIESNVVVGNVNGIVLVDNGAQQYRTFRQVTGVSVTNNDIVDNTFGMVVVATGPQQTAAQVANNIFTNNGDPKNNNQGAAIYSAAPNRISLSFNMFSNNGANQSSPADDVLGVGGGVNPAGFSANPDQFGNFTGKAAFVNARDPRPGGDGPANFYSDANYDLTTSSNAIDNASSALAPGVDFRYRSRTFAAGHTHHANTGPADVGAFEFNGLFGIAGPSLSRSLVSALSTTSGSVSKAVTGGSADTAATDAALADSGTVLGNPTVSNGLNAVSTPANAPITSTPVSSTPATSPAPSTGTPVAPVVISHPRLRQPLRHPVAHPVPHPHRTLPVRNTSRPTRKG